MAHTPETGGHGPDKPEIIKKLKELLNKILGKKNEEAERVRKAEKYKKEKEEEENEVKRKEARKIDLRKDEERRYHQVRSAQIEELEAKMSDTVKAEEVYIKLNKVLDESNTDAVPEGAAYFVDEIRKNADVQETVRQLISDKPGAREALNEFLTKGRAVHGSVKRLIALSESLVYEANNISEEEFIKIKPLLDEVAKRANELIVDEFKNANASAGRYGQRFRTVYEYLQGEPGLILKGQESVLQQYPLIDERGNFTDQNLNEIKSAITSLITEPRPVDTNTQALEERRDWTEKTSDPPDGKVAGAIVSDINGIWAEMERQQEVGEIPVEDLVKYAQKIREAESKYFPSDLPPGSDGYKRALEQMNEYTDKKYNILLEKYKERLRKEKPAVKMGITDPEQFIREAGLSKGQLGRLLDANPAMRELLLDLGPEGRKFRDRVFLAIHAMVLTDQRNDSRNNFGLYETADFSSFLDILRTDLGKYRVKNTSRTLGDTLIDHYNNLSNTIKQCRDIDFWASQPVASIENFNKSLGLFQNEYFKTAFNIPAVNAAFRSYETVLRSIMTSNDGYIPAGLIEYNDTRKASYWDTQARSMVEHMISRGAIPSTKRDDRFQLEVMDENGYSFQFDDTKPLKSEDISPDEIKMYMTLAKGMGMATARYLEIFAQQRVPGSKNPELGMNRFHSVPYDGVATALNYFNMFINKWEIGSYKFFYLFNQLVPNPENRLTLEANNSLPGIQAFMAYQEGGDVFEKKYGPDAKKFMDLLNFTNISSALGKDTSWRQYDSTYRWSDKAREKLGSATQISISERYAEEKVKEILLETEYKAKYRDEMKQRGMPTSGAEFDMLWREYGSTKFKTQMDKEWDRITGKDPLKGAEHTKLSHETSHMIDAYKKAFRARKWAEMAMRNPLAVAHSLKVNAPLVGYEEQTKEIKLHRLIVHEVLGIPPEATKYAKRYGQSAEFTSPDAEQMEYMDSILQLERDLAAVRERAVNEGRDLREEDFHEVIGKKEGRSGVDADLRPRVENAINYWKTVRKLIIGDESVGATEHFYDDIGLKYINEEDYEWDYNKIHRIDYILEHMGEGSEVSFHNSSGHEFNIGNLLNKAVNTEMEWMYATDDMAMNQMDLLTLGSKQLLRRGGDIGSHFTGGSEVANYIMHFITPDPDKHKAAEQLLKIRDAYSGDMIQSGWSVVGNLAYMTDRLYAFDWKRLGSAAQLDVWKTKRNVAAWIANGRREWWDSLEHLDVLPPHAHFYAFGIPNKTDIHTLEKLTHSTNEDVWKEILLLGVTLAVAMTIWRAFSAKSEEDEGGGGGHH